jgi:hypothetical protein
MPILPKVLEAAALFRIEIAFVMEAAARVQGSSSPRWRTPFRIEVGVAAQDRDRRSGSRSLFTIEIPTLPKLLKAASLSRVEIAFVEEAAARAQGESSPRWGSLLRIEIAFVTGAAARARGSSSARWRSLFRIEIAVFRSRRSRRRRRMFGIEVAVQDRDRCSGSRPLFRTEITVHGADPDAPEGLEDGVTIQDRDPLRHGGSCSSPRKLVAPVEVTCSGSRSPPSRRPPRSSGPCSGPEGLEDGVAVQDRDRGSESKSRRSRGSRRRRRCSGSRSPSSRKPRRSPGPFPGPRTSRSSRQTAQTRVRYTRSSSAAARIWTFTRYSAFPHCWVSVECP